MAGRQRRGSQFWQDLIGEFSAADESAARFAQRRGVSPSTFQYWLKKHRQSTAIGAPSVRLLPVVPRGSDLDHGLVEVVLGDIRLRFSTNVDVEYVARLCAVLRHASC